MASGRVDYRHCEAYQIAAACMSNVHLLPPEDQLMEMRRQEAEKLQQQKRNMTGRGATEFCACKNPAAHCSIAVTGSRRLDRQAEDGSQSLRRYTARVG